MAVTVLQRPIGFTLGTAVTATITDSGGFATVNDTAHGLVDGDYVYIKSDVKDYNGFWYVDKINNDTYQIKQYATATSVSWVRDTSIVTYYEATQHGVQCVHLPIVYKLSSNQWPTNSADTVRTISSVTNSNNYCALALSGDIKASGSAGILEFVKVTNSGGGGSLDGVYQIVAYTNDTTFSIDLAYSSTNDTNLTGASIQYYYNSYCIRVRVYGGIPSTHPYESIKPFEVITELKLIPDEDGIAMFSINEILKSDINNRNEPLLGTMPNNLDFWTDFYINYAESWDVLSVDQLITHLTSYTSDSNSFTGMAVNAKLPFKNIYSGHMSEYLISTGGEFLTMFDTPTIFEGEYFDVSFILDQDYYSEWSIADLSEWLLRPTPAGVAWTGGPATVTLLSTETSRIIYGAISPTETGKFYFLTIELGSSVPVTVDITYVTMDESLAYTASYSSPATVLAAGMNYLTYTIGGNPNDAFFGLYINNSDVVTTTLTLYNVKMYPLDDPEFSDILINQNNDQSILDASGHGVYRLELNAPNCDAKQEQLSLYHRRIVPLASPGNWTNDPGSPDAYDVKGWNYLRENFDTGSLTYTGAYTTFTAIPVSDGVAVTFDITITITGTWAVLPGDFLQVNVYLKHVSGTNYGFQIYQFTTNGTYSYQTTINIPAGSPDITRIMVEFDNSFLFSGSGTVEITIPDYFYFSSATPNITKTLDVSCNCLPTGVDGIYLTWLNYKGGFDYWRFEAQQIAEVDVSDSIVAENNIFPDWPRSYGEFADTIRKEVYRESYEVRNVRSQLLTEQQVQAIKYLRTSTIVQIIESKYDRRTVLVDKDSFVVVDEGNKMHTIAFKITYTDPIPVQA